ncbi:lysosome-associated membrane glycoprotein 2 isoform X1 [Limanda limanda]|uniref:lysosome-associated membrane glycoprotein 2 isoform X1 n=1 Tax=Limanda limanda TaxID=27771 RepID=UPI0029C7BA63|nr:lysosome-associated membrane glycoprotein 2 isoform X1 [Limanda limanda]
MARFAAFVPLLLAGIVFQLSHGVEVNVTDKDGKLCLYANLTVHFSVSYAVGEKKDTAEFELPSAVTTIGSECGATSSTLKLNFGDGHSLSVNFTLGEILYQADDITFSYNLSDATVFPGSGLKETKSVTVKSQITNVDVGTCYSCNSKDMIPTDLVNMTLSSVLIQAFVTEGRSAKITSCSADSTPSSPPTAPPPTTSSPTTPPTTTSPPTTPPTTTSPPTTPPTTTSPTTTSPTTTSPTTTSPTTTSPTTTSPTTTPPTTTSPPTTSPPTTPPTTTSPPTTHPTTTSPPTTSPPPTTHDTNATTPSPVTNATTAAPTPTPTPTLPTPNIGKYSVNSTNTTVCLLATFGLRIGIKQGETYQEMNLDANETKATGSCGVNSSELQLVSSTMTIMLTFINDTAKFRLHAVNVTAKTGAGVDFTAVNPNLTLWEAAIGSSYMCNKEQNYSITNMLNFYTFNLRVQPFGITTGDFNTAHECSLDDTSILIPIIVGAALAGLILIVVVAYVIGRRKTYVGYQTL